METNWNSHGVLAKSLVESWPLELAVGAKEGSVASDGQYLYIHGPFGLLKVGSGYGNTKKVGLSGLWKQEAGKVLFTADSLGSSSSIFIISLSRLSIAQDM